MKRTQTITTLSAAIAALALTGSAWAAGESRTSGQTRNPEAVGEKATQNNISKDDQTFLRKAAEVNLTEIELGRVAEARATDPDLKRMGQALSRDHTTAQQQLQKLSAAKGVTLPTQLSEQQRQKIAAIAERTGEQFDKKFTQENIQAHKQAISLFEKAANRTNDPDIKAWANQMLPGLKEHLASAQSGQPEAVGEQRKQQKMREQRQQQQQQQQQQSHPGMTH